MLRQDGNAEYGADVQATVAGTLKKKNEKNMSDGSTSMAGAEGHVSRTGTLRSRRPHHRSVRTEGPFGRRKMKQ